jgi:hypothetical protein
LLSIGLFLITVLFLGAGGFIEKATLGTLLGTLAGYLFTRRSSPGTLLETGSGGALPEMPATPSYTAASQMVSLPAMPRDATFVTAYAKPVAGGPVITLGHSPNKELTLPAGKLTTGTAYELWFTATNARGETKPGPHITLTA